VAAEHRNGKADVAQEPAKVWIERPVEPVIAKGRGMAVLGFVPVQGLKALQVAPLAPRAEPPPACDASRRQQHEGYSAVRGSYKRYYGYRPGGSGDSDRRLMAVSRRIGADCFEGKDVLDIGCNRGSISLAVARHFGARRVVGVDVDEQLVEAASSAAKSSASGECEVEFRAEDFLTSPLRRGTSSEPERFDVIMCLSVTKWVHYALGDAGVQKLFRRVWRRLQPGGLFVLEPQEWRSYKKKQYLTPEIRETVRGIEMRPEAFDEYLLSIGFEHEDTIPAPSFGPAGFRRSIRLFRRPATALHGLTSERPAKAEGSKPRRVAEAAHEEVSVQKRKKVKDYVEEEGADEAPKKAKKQHA